jgi:plastocyanin
MNRLTRCLAIALTGTAMALVAACSGSSAPKPSAETTGTAEPGLGGQHITIEANDDFRFTPSVIEANPGKLTITVVNAGKVPHDFVLSTFNAKTDTLNSGDSGTVTIDIGSPGTYDFLCTFHASQGMKGRLVVR